ncbi:MAG: triose-phosphate isomerase [Pseudomonadota bacterium]
MALKYVGTSWKMNKNLGDAMRFATALAAADAGRDARIQRFVIPPFTSAREVKTALADTSVLVGAQNMHWADEGAWTGEISGPMLVDCGLDIVELGHSERRAHFGETDETVGRKVNAALRHGLVPLICVGESRQEYEAGQAAQRVAAQVRRALSFIGTAASDTTVLFAYEPVWAIGEGGVPASPDYASERQSQIIDVASECLGVAVPCLYGGSVNVENCGELISSPSVDGLFIGRAAWSVNGYIEILDRCAAAI